MDHLVRGRLRHHAELDSPVPDLECGVVGVRGPHVGLDGGVAIRRVGKAAFAVDGNAHQPTPGSAGLAELALPTFLSGVLPLVLAPATWTALVLVWRLLTYHLYVLMGAMTLPVWLKQTGAPSRTFRNP